MRVGILALKTGTAAGGLATYESGLIHAIAEQDRENEYHIFCVAPISRQSFKIDQPNFVFHELKPRKRLLNLAWSAPRAMRRAGVDLFHVVFLPPLWSGLPFVFTAHGPEMFIDRTFFPWKIRIILLPLIRRCYRRASSILCVSGDTRSYIVKHYPDAEARSRVVYNGCLDAFHQFEQEGLAKRVEEKFNITGPYVLGVGRIEPRKNPIGLLESYAIFRREAGERVRLVIAGGHTWSAGEAEAAIQRLGIADDVVRLGHVSHDDLPLLYAGARMFVFPSLWEGFGLPVIEAMRCGTPVITSELSCLPEVAGGAALLVDPRDPNSIARQMLRLNTDPALRKEMTDKGLARGNEFSWRRCAAETIQAYHDLYNALNK